MRVLVMGGSRFAGPKVVAALIARGHRVTVFNRRTRPSDPSAGVVQIVGDRDDAANLHQLSAADYDAVVDMSAYLRTQTESLLDVLGSVERWVHISTGAVYRPSQVLPWSESTAYGPWDIWGAYAVEKLGCEIALHARRGDDRSTVALRFPVILGPANYVAREEFVFNRLLDGGEILVPGDGRAVVQFVSIDQVGDAVARAVDTPPAGWLPVNIGNPSFTSLTGFVELCADIVGVEPDIRTTPASSRPFDPYDAVFPFPNENYVLETTASQVHGLAPAPVAVPAMLRAAFDHLIAHPERRVWQRSSAENAVMATL